MRVSLTGTFGVGKTTLGTSLAPRLGLPLLPEVARSFLDAGLAIDTAMAQAAVSLVQADRERGRGAFVSDRSLIDCLAYSRIGRRRAAPDSIEIQIFDACAIWCMSSLAGRYSHVVLVDTDVDLPSQLAGYEAFRADVRAEILDVVAALDVPLLRVAGTPVQCLETAVAWLEGP